MDRTKDIVGLETYKVNEAISLNDFDAKLRGAEDLSEMEIPIRECLEDVDLPQVILDMVNKDPREVLLSLRD